MYKRFKQIFISVITFLVFSFSSTNIFAAQVTPTPSNTTSLPQDGANYLLYPSTGNFQIGSKFTVLVQLNTAGKSINAATGKIRFTSDVIEFEKVSRSGSVLTIWTKEPTLNENIIEFGGGLPSPGYTGETGLVFSLTFKTKQEGKIIIEFIDGNILANDGQGTDILTAYSKWEFTVTKDPTNTPTPKPTTETSYQQDQQDKVIKASPTSIFDPEVLAGLLTPTPDERKTLDKAENLEFPSSINKKDRFYIKGNTKYPNTQINVSVMFEENDIEVFGFNTDENGSFYYEFSRQFKPGKYKFWLEIVNTDGDRSEKSDTFEFEVIETVTEKVLETSYMLFWIIIPLLILGIFIFLLIKRIKERKKEEERKKAEQEELLALKKQAEEEEKNKEDTPKVEAEIN